MVFIQGELSSLSDKPSDNWRQEVYEMEDDMLTFLHSMFTGKR